MLSNPNAKALNQYQKMYEDEKNLGIISMTLLHPAYM